MLIGIDGNEANIEKRVGVNEYAFELLWALYRLKAESSDPITYKVFLKNRPLTSMPPETNFWKYEVIFSQRLWIITKLMTYLFKTKGRPDVFFSPSHYLPPFSPVARVCSIMDLGYLEFSGQFKKTDFWQLKLWSAISIYISKRIIAISNSTKKDIVRHYPFASNKIVVTHPGYDKSKYNTEISQEDVRRVRNKYHIVNDYILFLSTLKPSKNIEGLLEAYAKISKKEVPKTQSDILGYRNPVKNDKISLVIAGKKGWLYSPIYKKVKELKIEGRVIFTDFVSHEDKPALVAGAKLFVSPSFWEGFGLHVLEAMACGVPVVTSGRGSIPEIVADLGIIVDPKDPNDIARGIQEVLSMEVAEYNRLKVKLSERAKSFDWNRTARQTLAVLKDAVKK